MSGRIHPLEIDPPLQGSQGDRLRHCPSCRMLNPEEGGALGCPVCQFRRALGMGSERESGLSGVGLFGLDDDRFDLENISDEASAHLLRALGVKGPEAELRLLGFFDRPRAP